MNTLDIFLSYLSENVTLLTTCEANNIIITFLPIVTKTVTEIVTKIVTKLLQKLLQKSLQKLLQKLLQKSLQKLLQKSLQKLLQKFYYYSVLYCISWQCLSEYILPPDSFLMVYNDISEAISKT